MLYQSISGSKDEGIDEYFFSATQHGEEKHEKSQGTVQGCILCLLDIVIQNVSCVVNAGWSRQIQSLEAVWYKYHHLLSGFEAVIMGQKIQD